MSSLMKAFNCFSTRKYGYMADNNYVIQCCKNSTTNLEYIDVFSMNEVVSYFRFRHLDITDFNSSFEWCFFTFSGRNNTSIYDYVLPED